MPGDFAGAAFVGREAALAALTGALGKGAALALVDGEAGIGKTRLVQECLASPVMRDRLVVSATCPPLREPFPLGPIVDGLRRLRERVAEIELSPLCGALRPIFPEWAAELPPALESPADPLEVRHRLFRALIEVVERLGVDVLVIEDAHWADSATLEWLLTLSASGEHAERKTSVVVTYRPLDVPSGSTLLRLTSRQPAGMRPVRISLEPLGVEETSRLVASMLAAGDVSPRFAEFLHEHTAGIPLAVEECVRLLRDRRDIVRSRSGWTRRVVEELRVPPTLRDSVLERVERLSPPVRAVLEAAAVLGELADETLLAAVAGLDDDAVREGVAGALAAGLLRENERGAFGYRHVLAAKAVEDAIPAPMRRHLHRRAGEALSAAEHPPVVRLSRHFREANDVDAWCHYARASARLALESGDDHTAISMLHDLLTQAEHEPERRALLARELGETAALGVAPLGEVGARVVDTLEEVLAHPEVPADERGEIRLRLARLRMHLGEYAAGSAALEAAVPDLAHRPALAAQAMLYLAISLAGTRPASWHLEWVRRAVPLLDRIEDPAERLLCAANHATSLLLLGEEEGWGVAEAMPRTTATRAERRELLRGRLNIAQLATLWGRYGDAGRWVAEVRREVDATGFSRLSNSARIGQARLDWYTGAWDRLPETAGELAESTSAYLSDRLEAQLVLAELDLARGVPYRARERLREVLERQSRQGNTDPFVIPAAPLARIGLAEGDADEALAATGPVMDMIVRKEVWLWAADVAPVHLDALVAAGRLDEARELVAGFGGWAAGRDVPPAAAASLGLCRAVVAQADNDHHRAAGLYGEAQDTWAALPRPYDALLARERRGRCLLAGGERDQGLRVLGETLSRLRDLGARWDADRVAGLLRAHGVDVANAWRGGRRGYGDRLSPRELEVAGLVARGWTNRKIAETLFLSPRTVDRHLSTAMRKLSVTSRTALAAAVSEAGLLTAEQGDGPL
ncbi:helix-turn-helix transcriptional regulator [Nonomuraea deserti]|uniref:helix-turn-helix transcriptional regulator n=1 Tax=Nonomuraea deserti TaxID=1848322 RepID=UPI001404EFC3|nr:LuxR family transcriptional regulator [Nonomuraea deserti]